MELELRFIRLDVTPPVGDYLCGGYHDRSIGIERRLYLDGVVLSWGEVTVALTTMDFCYLSGKSHQRLVEAIAKGAGIPVTHVAAHANHVHDAPLIDEEPHHLVENYVPSLRIHNEAWFADLLTRTTAAMKAAMASPGIPITRVSFVEQCVEQFGSTRRVLDEKGKCEIRWSVCRDLPVRNAPLGKIDPQLSQIALFDAAGSPRAVLNFYASHPQVSDGRKLISSDTVGVAREHFASECPDIPCIYFTGCAGDVTAGKFTTPDREQNQAILGKRLGEAMVQAVRKAEVHPISAMNWFQETVDLPTALPFRPVEEVEMVLRSPDSSPKEKYQAAQQMLRSCRKSYPFQLQRLSFGWFDLLFLPAEMVVEYQLYSKAIAQQNLAAAAYGDSFMMYVPTDEMFGQGGYEVREQWTHSVPGNEKLIKSTIHRLLKRTKLGHKV